RSCGCWLRCLSPSCCLPSSSSFACAGSGAPSAHPARMRRPRHDHGLSAVAQGTLTMSWQLAAMLLLGGSTVLLLVGMPVALSFVAINIVGAWLFLGGEAGLGQVVRNSVVS